MTSAPEMSPSPQPMCSEHPDRVAVSTCERCGRYVCAGCARGGARCPECIHKGVEAVPSSAARGRRAALFLRLAGGMAAVGLFINVWTVMAPGEDGVREAVEGIAALVGLAVFVTTPIMYLMWQHRAVRQLNAMGVDVGATPGWSVGYWFVPFVNLVKPFRIVRGMAEELGGQELVASLQLSAWWAMLLLARILDRIEGRMVMQNGLDGPTPMGAYVVGIGSSLCTIVAAVLCVRIVREVQDRLEARRGAL